MEWVALRDLETLRVSPLPSCRCAAIHLPRQGEGPLSQAAAASGAGGLTGPLACPENRCRIAPHHRRGRGGIGRRSRLKICRPQGRAGSIPAARTTLRPAGFGWQATRSAHPGRSGAPPKPWRRRACSRHARLCSLPSSSELPAARTRGKADVGLSFLAVSSFAR